LKMLSRFNILARSSLLARRLISTGQILQNDSQKSVSKEALVNLRKKTGYSYSNCRKALLEFGEDNLVKAEKWLKEAARKEGWAKVEKLGGRQASQGLIAVACEGNVVSLLELNCETDFVARSEDFKNLVEEISLSILERGKELSKSNAPTSKEEFVTIPADDAFETSKGRSVKEAIALSVGQLKENIVVKKAEAIISNPKVSIQAYAHPHFGTNSVQMGQFASIVGILRTDPSAKFPTETLAHQICQHIIGMRPESLGTPKKHDKTVLELLDTKEFKEEKESDELNDFADVQSTQIDENETQLLRQSFMLSPGVTIHEHLTSHSAQLSWFIRTELGEEPKEQL